MYYVTHTHTLEFIYLFQQYPITNIQMQISIKPICDCPIYLTASADWLALHRLPFTPLHLVRAPGL